MLETFLPAQHNPMLFFLSRNYWSITKPFDPFKKLCAPEPCYTLLCILAWRYIADGDDAFFVKNPRILNDRLVRLEKSTRQGVTPNKWCKKNKTMKLTATSVLLIAIVLFVRFKCKCTFKSIIVQNYF